MSGVWFLVLALSLPSWWPWESRVQPPCLTSQSLKKMSWSWIWRFLVSPNFVSLTIKTLRHEDYNQNQLKHLVFYCSELSPGHFAQLMLILLTLPFLTGSRTSSSRWWMSSRTLLLHPRSVRPPLTCWLGSLFVPWMCCWGSPEAAGSSLTSG